MRNVIAVFLKQIKETLKNKPILIQFIMFPLMTLVMEKAITIENMPEHFFVKLFSVMFIGMAPITCMSSIIAEEKEKDTLRALVMSNVSPVQYLLGIGAYVLLFCMAGSTVFAICGEYKGNELVQFMGIMALGILLSMLFGAAIGIASANQMAATSVSVPVMLVFSMLPMLAVFNDKIEKIASITFSHQINNLVNGIGGTTETSTVIIIAVNLIIALTLFAVFFKKKGLE